MLTLLCLSFLPVWTSGPAAQQSPKVQQLPLRRASQAEQGGIPKEFSGNIFQLKANSNWHILECHGGMPLTTEGTAARPIAIALPAEPGIDLDLEIRLGKSLQRRIRLFQKPMRWQLDLRRSPDAPPVMHLTSESLHLGRKDKWLAQYPAGTARSIFQVKPGAYVFVVEGRADHQLEMDGMAIKAVHRSATQTDFPFEASNGAHKVLLSWQKGKARTALTLTLKKVYGDGSRSSDRLTAAQDGS